MQSPIQFIDLNTQRDRIRARVDARLAAVLDSGAYIMGPEIAELEDGLSRFGGMERTIACGSGTDALALPLMAWGLKPNDAVFVPSFTFAATAEVVAWFGAVPVFVDVFEDTYNMDPASLRRAIEEARAGGRLNPHSVIAVDLFGQIADYAAIRAICDEFGLKLISDAAQGFGSTRDGKTAAHWADVVATSFYPAKPLGCYGDGGAVQTNDAELDAVMRSLRVHGSGTDRYDNVRIGMNARMDTLQAAILLEKLAIFPEEIEVRMRAAARYAEALGDVVAVPRLPDGVVSTWAQYTIRLKPGTRDAFAAAMHEAGVPTVVYYARPLHRQTAYAHYPLAGNGLPVTDRLAETVISLPMHAYLDEATQDRIIAAVRTAL